MSKPLGFNVELPLAFDAAATRVREALKQEGFGVLTEIDLRAAFREKLGQEFRPYVILGACNPPLAFSAISADPSAGPAAPVQRDGRMARRREHWCPADRSRGAAQRGSAAGNSRTVLGCE